MILSFYLSVIILGNSYKKILIENSTDELTGVKNYKALEKDLNNLLNQPLEKPTSLILIDIDNFKKFNKKFTYEIADNVMKKLGDLLKADSRITDETYRYFLKGDEFLIIAKNTNLQNAKKASNRKRKLIQEASFVIENQSYNITVCCSVTELNEKDDKKEILERLQKGMQKAKENQNKNRTEICI